MAEAVPVQIAPLFLQVDGVDVEIIEASKQPLISGETWYVVSVRVIYKGIPSRVFPLFVRSREDLMNKLKVEVTKLKVLDYSLGLEEVRRLIC